MKMVKNEWRFIRHNRLILLSVIVMTIIPLLYSVFFLKSVWDPYGDTQNLPVAVVNQDKPVDYNGETLNVGKETVNNLKNNDQLGWRFVSEKQAKRGLSNQKYYTVITLPKNFSKNATTVLDKKPKKMQLSYKTNGSLNYIGEVISQMGASTLDKQIRAAVTNAYASAIFDQLHVVGKGMKTASSGATQLDKGIVTLNDGLGQYTVAVSQVNDGVQTLKTSVKPLAGGVSQLATGGNQLVSGVNTYTGGVSQLAAGIATLNQSVGPLASGVNQLANGGNQLVAKSGELNSGAQQVAGGLGTLQSNVGPLANGVNKLATGSKKLTSGISAYTKGTKSARAGSSQLADGLDEMNKSVTTMPAQVDELNNGLKQLDTGSQAVADGILKVNQGVSSQDSQLTALNKGLGQMKDGLTELNSQVNSDEVSQAISDLQQQVAGLDGATTAATTSLTKIKENTQTTATAAGSLKEQISASDLETAQKAKLLAEVQKIGTAQASNGTELQNVQTALAPLKEINVDQLKALSAKIQSLQGAINKLYAGYVTGANGQTSLYNGGLEAIAGLRSVQENTAKDSDLYRGATDVSNGIASASTGVNTLSQKLPDLTGGLGQLVTGANQLDSGLGELTANSGALNSGAATLSGGIGTMNGQIPTLTNGVNQLSTGSKQLASGVQQYTGGTGQVANGLNQMNSQVPTLVSGVGQLYTGSQTLNANSGALNDGAGQLANGLNQMNSQVPTLTSGVSQLADGTSQLDAKSEDLTDGGGKLSKGSGTLANALGDGSKKVNGIHTTDKTANMFAKPTKLKHHKYSYVSNYGHALAPYVLSVALYVGALVFNFAYPIRKISTRGQSATAWFFSKASVGGVVAIMMAVIEASLMMLFGLNVDHVGSFYLIAIIFALASMFIVMMLSMAFDNPGRFVAMVLLMLQLGGSGGTFPMEVTNSFYNVIHAYLPMTYSILGFRQAITSGLGSGQIWSSFFTLAGVVVVSLLLLWWVMKILQQIHLNGVSQLDDNQKLQDLEH